MWGILKQCKSGINDELLQLVHITFVGNLVVKAFQKIKS